MEIVSSLVSLTVAKVLRFSGLDRNVLKMEEKALEVYGKRLNTCSGGSTRELMSADRGLSAALRTLRMSVNGS